MNNIFKFMFIFSILFKSEVFSMNFFKFNLDLDPIEMKIRIRSDYDNSPRPRITNSWEMMKYEHWKMWADRHDDRIKDMENAERIKNFLLKLQIEYLKKKNNNEN